eukprot:scaffold143603_cov22-Tisochrysis_lutea.AAC.1
MEFHDHTHASNFEKFVAVVEQTLKSWSRTGRLFSGHGPAEGYIVLTYKICCRFGHNNSQGFPGAAARAACHGAGAGVSATQLHNGCTTIGKHSKSRHEKRWGAMIIKLGFSTAGKECSLKVAPLFSAVMNWKFQGCSHSLLASGCKPKALDSHHAPCHLPGKDPTIDHTLTHPDINLACEVCACVDEEYKMQLPDGCGTGWSNKCNITIHTYTTNNNKTITGTLQARRSTLAR